MSATAAQVSAPSRTDTVAFEDIAYREHDGKPLLARLYKPAGSGPFPMLIDIHGGAWCSQDRLTNAPISQALARAGILVAALDFRMPPDGGYPASLQDINYAVRWLKQNAARFDGKPGKVGAIGISSGGHQAMLAAMRPRDVRYAALPLADGAGVDATIAAVVLYWPVIDPVGRYRYGKALQAKGGTYPEQIDRVLPQHDLYWRTEAAMEEGTPAAILEKGETVAMPPVLYVQGAEDLVHPRAQLERFVDVYRRHGGNVDLALYAGEGGGFVVRDTVDPANAADALARTIAFVHRHLG